MKKIIVLSIMFFFCIMPIPALAESAAVEVKISGQVKRGESIEIFINVKDVERLYAASVDFTYDTELLKVNTISSSEFIGKYSNDIMELGGETDKNGNTAAYSFTFLGDKKGLSGSGTLVTISATVLKDHSLEITEDNMKIKLVKRNNDTVENYDYKFIESNSKNNNSSIDISQKTDSNEDNPQGNNEETNTSNNDLIIEDATYNNSDEESVVSNEDTDSDNNSISADDSKNEDDKNSKKQVENSEIKNVNLLSNKRDNTILYSIVSCLVIGTIGIGGYYIYKRRKKK